MYIDSSRGEPIPAVMPSGVNTHRSLARTIEIKFLAWSLLDQFNYSANKWVSGTSDFESWSQQRKVTYNIIINTKNLHVSGRSCKLVAHTLTSRKVRYFLNISNGRVRAATSEPAAWYNWLRVSVWVWVQHPSRKLPVDHRMPVLSLFSVRMRTCQNYYIMTSMFLWLVRKAITFCTQSKCICVENSVKICRRVRELCVILYPARQTNGLSNEHTCQNAIFGK